ncbi:translation initiation factor IF-2 [Patescibacteria group bacterium]
MEKSENKSQTRPPIVTVLGHVDHGKTTLLDAIRKTSVVEKEAGGITQKIGASVVQTPEGKNITFIDTPGHTAFSQMRSRGANVADIAILVVAADDGVKPQTKEALEIIKTSNTPYLVVISKTDTPSANPEAVKGELEKEGVLFEGRGGDTPLVNVSAKEEKGLKELLETIILMAEVIGIKSSVTAPLEAVVIESYKDKQGPVASVVVRDGSLKVGEAIYAEGDFGKVRALNNDKGENIKVVLPGEPAQVIGFGMTPAVGAVVTKTPNKQVFKEKESRLGEGIRKLKKDIIAVLIKASSKGGLEAVITSLPEKVVVIENGVGDVNDSDVLQAKSSGARIFAFDVKVPRGVIGLAKEEGVEIEKFDIIYELLQRLNEILEEGKLKILGKASILATFPFDSKKVAGGKVLEGKIIKGAKVIIMREEEEVGKAKIKSLKRQKEEIAQALAGEEFGAILEPQLDFSIGDVILSVASKNG